MFSEQDSIQIQESDIQALITQAIQAFEFGDQLTARQILDTAVKNHPNNAKIWAERGGLMAALGELSEEIKSYTEVLRITPYSHKAFYNRGTALMYSCKPHEAILDYEQALYLEPEKDEAWNNKGLALALIGETRKAIFCFQKAFQINPSNHDSLYNKGKLFQDSNQAEEAIKIYEMLLCIAPNHYKAWNNRGNLLRAAGRLNEAIASYNQALSINPRLGKAWANRGIAIVSVNHYNPLVESQRLILSFRPISAQLLSFLDEQRSSITSDLTEGGYEGQLQTLRRGLKYCPISSQEHGFLQLELGHVYFENAQKQQGSQNTLMNAARACYEKARDFFTAANSHPEDYPQALSTGQKLSGL